MPKQPREEVAFLRSQLVEATGGRCEWPGCLRSYHTEMAHRRAKGMGGRSRVYLLDDVFLLCRIHHRCQDGAGGNLVDGISRHDEIVKLWESIDPLSVPGDALLTIDTFITLGTSRTHIGLARAITDLLTHFAFPLRTPPTDIPARG